MKNVKKTKQVISILVVIVLVTLWICTFVFALTGNPNFLPMLMVSIIIPIFVWAFLFFYRRGNNNGTNASDQKNNEN